MVGRAVGPLLALGLLLAAPLVAGGGPVEDVMDTLRDPTDPVLGAPGLPDPEPEDVTKAPQVLVDWMEGSEPADPGAPGGGGLGDRLRDVLRGNAGAAGLAGVLATMLGVGGFALVTRYVSPREALQNPQRAMLFGFIKATPGVHLKQLSEEFNMKTSSILWHIRKLEAADLVRSERANGFRVFYTVAGGVELKKVSRAMTALQNENARAIQALVERHPGITVRAAAERLGVHSGTVRWHLRKLRDFGLVEELVREDGSLFYVTPLGRKTMEALLGAPVSPLRPLPRAAAPVK